MILLAMIVVIVSGRFMMQKEGKCGPIENWGRDGGGGGFYNLSSYFHPLIPRKSLEYCLVFYYLLWGGDTSERDKRERVREAYRVSGAGKLHSNMANYVNLVGIRC